MCFLQRIMENEAKADVLKGALFSFGDGSRLFKEIDVDNHGYISMEDILKFCQRENMELN